MIVTPEEAENLTCPRMSGWQFCRKTCDGPECMMWEWETKEEEAFTDSPYVMPEGDGWEERYSSDRKPIRWSRDVRTGKGYCGA